MGRLEEIRERLNAPMPAKWKLEIKEHTQYREDIAWLLDELFRLKIVLHEAKGFISVQHAHDGQRSMLATIEKALVEESEK